MKTFILMLMICTAPGKCEMGVIDSYKTEFSCHVDMFKIKDDLKNKNVPIMIFDCVEFYMDVA